MPTKITPKIGFICGSLRKQSINKKLENALAKRFTRAGAKCIYIDLGEYDLPLFHGDLDTPENLKALTAKLRYCDGIVIVSPEYNGGLPPVLKNAIDWTTTDDMTHFHDRYWGIASCTPGPMSGIMGMRQINYILNRVGTHVSPFQVGVGNADKAFDADGELIGAPGASIADNLVADMLARI